MPPFEICPGCQSPITEGKPCVELRWGSLEGDAFEEDETADVVLLCYACADAATSVHSQMEGRY